MTENQPPSVGRIVHYQNTGERCMAAMITQVYVDTGAVNLVVYPPMAHAFNVDGVMRGETYDKDSWHWPERV